MKAGAHDYIMKDNLTRLVPAIGRELQDAEDRKSRRHAETALRESEERFRTMADSAPVLLWVTEENGACSYVNKPWLEFTGQSLEEERGSGWRATMHPEDAPAVIQSYQQNSALQRRFQSEYRLRRQDGEWRWMLETATPRFHTDGAFSGYIGSVVDLTERKRAEIDRESVRAENERLMAERAATMVAQREFLKDILCSVTEGKLVLCDARDDLPPALPVIGGPFPLTKESLRDVRHSSRDAGGILDLQQERCDDLVTAVGEAGMNAIVHGGGGQARVCVGPDKLQVWIEDQGQGIDIKQLPRATLERGYTTASSFGHGFYMMLSLVDRVFLLTGSSGTCIVLEQFLVAPEPIWLQGLPIEAAA
jgi:PAS domain S-box-containing protein